MEHLIPDNAQLGAAVLAHLKARDMSLRDGAQALGISLPTLSRITRGYPMSGNHYQLLLKKIWFAPIFPIA